MVSKTSVVAFGTLTQFIFSVPKNNMSINTGPIHDTDAWA